MDEIRDLTARSHAYLFGVIARAIIDTYGEQGVQAITDGVIKYGRQRGWRMAQRTVADGFKTSVLNYVAYSEWSADPGEMDFAIPAKNPDIQFMIKKCPWYEIWEENDLLKKYGYLYCKYIDIAIAYGYNPSIQFDVLESRGLGDTVCDMRMRNANVTEQEEKDLASRVHQLGCKAKMPWDYHCAHLFKTLWEVVVVGFGYTGFETMQKALQTFSAVYGKEASDALLKNMEVDFNAMPPYIGLDG